VKKVLKIFLILVCAILVFGIGFILTLQIFEYRPDDITILAIDNEPENSVTNYVGIDETVSIMTFNTGYASLSATEDFVMDGGVKGRMDSIEEVEVNIAGIKSIITAAEADIYLLQEVDTDSDRSYNTMQYDEYSTLLSYSGSLGYNYRCIFVPFPFKMGQMMGSVDSGIATFSRFYTSDATRYQLPGSFSWPVSLANLKRCVVVSHLPISGSDKYLTIVNVHLSAYDDGTMRIQEMEALQNIVEAEYEAGNYVLVGGDFNQTFPDAVTITENIDGTETYDYLYPLKEAGLWEAYPMSDTWFTDNGFTFVNDISTPTCRLLNQPYDSENHDNNQYYSIDGFIVSANITVESIQVIDQDFLYSDHNPVLIEISFIH